MHSEKAFFLLANDFSEEKPLLEKFVIKFFNINCKFKITIGATQFRQSFNDAKEFNILCKSGEKEKLIYAPLVSEFNERINVNLKREVRSLSFCSENMNREINEEMNKILVKDLEKEN